MQSSSSLSVRSCANTHIPKLSKESASGLNRFGVVQIRIYQNLPSNKNIPIIGSELYKYTYTKTLLPVHYVDLLGSELYQKCIYQNVILDNISHTILVRSCVNNAYTKTSLPAETSNKRGSELNSTHIPKQQITLHAQRNRFGAVQKHIYQNKCSSCNK